MAKLRHCHTTHLTADIVCAHGMYICIVEVVQMKNDFKPQAKEQKWLGVLNVDDWQNPFHNPWAKSRDASNEHNYAMIRQCHATVNDL